MAQYDTYYQDENYFGKPYAGLMDFFRASARGTVADLGAGQGRDSIPLASMGYDVTSVDISGVGLEQIHRTNPQIETVLGDLHSFDVSSFDYILMDSIVHFYKSDLEKETALVQRILTQMKPGAIFVNCLLKSKRAEHILKEIVRKFEVTIVFEAYTDYPEFHAAYHLLAIQKNEDSVTD